MSLVDAGAAMPSDLVAGFLRSADAFASRPALDIAGKVTSYAELRERASRVCSALADADEAGRKLTAILGGPSVDTFAGILGALQRGHGYVPLNPDYPVARNAEVLARSGAHTLVVDHKGMPALAKLLEVAVEPMTVLMLGVDTACESGIVSARHRVLGARELPVGNDADRRTAGPDDPAYVLFTSGSTGRPKGVAVTQANARAFVRAACARFRPTPTDRFSQTFGLTFDLSVFDLFVAWESGACVCCASDAEKLMPGRYINDRGLTVWFSVPSAAALMGQLRQLKPGQYPGLRWSLFCGEALPRSLAESWAAAAPNSIVENLYGPTELTVACMSYRWDPVTSPGLCENGIVPIGWPLQDMSAHVVGEDLSEVAPGMTGELVMTGPQLSPGYIDDPEKTAAAFVRINGSGDVYYRTGDLVRRPSGDLPMTFLGRGDTQVKIRGFRVELGEVEAAVRNVVSTPIAVAVAVAWPRTESGADGIVVFVDDADVDLRALTVRVREILPPYMQPHEIRRISTMPRNSNGKVDRKAIEAILSSAPTQTG